MIKVQAAQPDLPAWLVPLASPDQLAQQARLVFKDRQAQPECKAQPVRLVPLVLKESPVQPDQPVQPVFRGQPDQPVFKDQPDQQALPERLALPVRLDQPGQPECKDRQAQLV